MTDDVAAALRAFGLTYPGAHLKSPWVGHLDLAVRDKTFAYLPPDGAPFQLSVKLPFTGSEVLTRPGAAPTPYGLGKAGWVTLSEAAPLDEMKAWIDESYRAQAPKTLIRQIKLA